MYELSGINRSITYATGLATGISRHFQINEYGLLHLGYFILSFVNESIICYFIHSSPWLQQKSVLFIVYAIIFLFELRL